MRNTAFRDDSGVNVMVEYLFMLTISMVLFTIFLLFVHSILDTSTDISLKEEFDIVSNDIANRISAFSGENILAGQPTQNSVTGINGKSVTFDLPQLAQGKQYNIKISYAGNVGTVMVSYVSNSNIYSTATFSSDVPIAPVSINSGPGRYRLVYDNNVITLEGGQ